MSGAPNSDPNEGTAPEDPYNPNEDPNDHPHDDLNLGPDASVALINNFEIISGIETTVSVGRAAVAQIAEDQRTWHHTLKMVFDLTGELFSTGTQPQLDGDDDTPNIYNFRLALMKNISYTQYDFATTHTDADGVNIANQAIQPLADLFDRDEDKNELAGVQSGKSSLTYIKKSKVVEWLHTDAVASQLFTVQQLNQLLDAAADRGKFVPNVDDTNGNPIANQNSQKFAFAAGDALSIIVRVVDSEAGNTRRWRIQLEQS